MNIKRYIVKIYGVIIDCDVNEENNNIVYINKYIGSRKLYEYIKEYVLPIQNNRTRYKKEYNIDLWRKFELDAY